MRLWVISHELAGLTLFSIPHIADHLRRLVQRHVGAFRPDPSAITDKLTSLDMAGTDPMAAMQAAFGDPEVLLGAVRSQEQIDMEPLLDTAVAVTIGVHRLGRRRRRRPRDRRQRAADRRGGPPSPGRDDARRHLRRTAARHPARQRADGRGKQFVQGVVDRAGENGLEPLFTSASAVPTPNEIEAPGLWLAR